MTWVERIIVVTVVLIMMASAGLLGLLGVYTENIRKEREIMANDMVMELVRHGRAGVITESVERVARWQINDSGDLIIYLENSKSKVYAKGVWLEFDVE